MSQPTTKKLRRPLTLAALLLGGLGLVGVAMFFGDPQAVRWFWHDLNPYYFPAWYAANLWLVFVGLLTASLLKSDRIQAVLHSFYASRFWQSVKTRFKKSKPNQAVVRFFLRREFGKRLLRKWLLFWNAVTIECYPVCVWGFTLAAVFVVLFLYSTAAALATTLAVTFITTLVAVFATTLAAAWGAILTLTATPRFYVWTYLIYFRDFIYYDIYKPFYVGPLVELNTQGEITWRLLVAPATGVLFIVWLLRFASRSKKKRNAGRLLSTLLALLSCGGLQAETSQKIILLEEARQVSERDILEASRSESEKNADGGYNAHVNVVDCFAAMEYRYTGGRYVDEPIQFRMLFPEEITPGQKYPLVLWFHGVGESGEDNIRQLSHVQPTIEYLTGKNKLDFFMIVTQCPSDNRTWESSTSNEGKGDAPLTIAEEIMSAVISEYPVDENRLSLFGICSGGNAVWELASRSPGRFAAVVACTSSLGNVTVDQFKGTAVWAFNNKLDPTPWEGVERFVTALAAQGGNAFVTLRDSNDHDTWTNALLHQKVIAWMILQDLQKGGPPAGAVCHPRTAGQVFLLFGLPVVAILCTLPFYRRKRKFHEETQTTVAAADFLDRER